MKTFTALVLTLLASNLFVRGAQAEVKDTRYRIDLRGGALAAETGRVHGAGPVLALGAGYLFSDRIDLTATGGTAAHGALLFGRTESFGSLTAGARYYPIGRDRRVRPWLAGETGWYHTRTVESSLFGGSHTQRVADGGGINIGTGFDIPLGRYVSLGTDVRYHQTIGVTSNPGFLTTLANLSFHFGS